MSTKERRMDRGRAKGLAAQQRFTSEIREARLELGRSQAEAAHEAGIARSTWTRIERGEQSAVTFELVGRMAAAVGLDLSLQLYPGDLPLRDSGQLEVMRDCRDLLGPDWMWRIEVRVSGGNDQRAWDMVGTHRVTGLTVFVDVESRLRDCQRVARRVEGKRVASGNPRVLLVLRASHHNRRAVAAARDMLTTAFPVDQREALRCLRQGIDPGGDALLLVDWRRVTPATPRAA